MTKFYPELQKEKERNLKRLSILFFLNRNSAKKSLTSPILFLENFFTQEISANDTAMIHKTTSLLEQPFAYS